MGNMPICFDTITPDTRGNAAGAVSVQTVPQADVCLQQIEGATRDLAL
jgi:hypothetical protein